MVSGTDRRQRTALIPVRCTPEERDAIAAKADRAGLAAGAFLRAAALGDAGPRAQRRPPADAQELRRLLGDLGRVGSNVNQIARALNRERQVEVPELRAALRAYLDLRSAILSALGLSPGKEPSKDTHDHQRRQSRRP